MSKIPAVFAAFCLSLAAAAWADEASIRKNLAERLPNAPGPPSPE